MKDNMMNFLDYLYSVQDLLSESSFKEINKITAEQFEYVIVYTYNIKHNIKHNKRNKNITSIDKKIIRYYQNHKQILNQIINAIDEKLNGKNVAELAKLGNNQDVKSSALKNLSTYNINMSGKGLKVPKTDIYSKVDSNVKISVKWANDCQLVSGGGPETLLLLHELIKKFQKSKKHNLTFLTKLISQTKNWNSTPKNAKVAFSDDYVNKIKKELLLHVNSDANFKRELITLAITGTYKFNNNSIAIPTYILEWSTTHPEFTKMFDINEYIDYIMSKRTIIIRFRPKSGGSTRYLTLSISVR